MIPPKTRVAFALALFALASASSGSARSSDAHVDGVRAPVGGSPDPVVPSEDGEFVIDFEGLTNGRVIRGDEYGELFTLTARGANAGLAIFDSSPGGPNDDGAAPDLLVGTGSLLILQNDLAPRQSLEGIFQHPDDDPDGGWVRFEFTSPMEPVSIDLVDLDDPAGSVRVVLVDSGGASRDYFVPGGFTGGIAHEGPPGFGRLDLTTLAPQSGLSAVATGAEDAGFEPTDVRAMTLHANESVAFDRLILRVGSTESCSYPQRSFPAIAGTGVETADLDGDGASDFVSVGLDQGNPVSGEVVVYLNPGDGRFRDGTAYPAGDSPVDLALGDLTGDGFPDIVVANRLLPVTGNGGGGISLLFNRGDGTFDPRVEIVLLNLMDSVVTRDFDGDGDLDVGVGGEWFMFFDPSYRPLWFFLPNDGTGTLAPIFVESTSAGRTGPLLAADLDGDAASDAVRSNANEDVLQVVLNDGSGSFDPPVDYPTLAEARNCALVDVDLDGHVDIVAAHTSIEVHRNLGDGTFGAPVSHGSIRGGVSVGTTDWNSDGYEDVVVGRSSGMTLFRNDGAGGFEQGPRYRDPSSPVGFAFADLDDDADVDFLIMSDDFDAGGVQVWPNRDGGHFRTRIRYPGSGSGYDVSVADVTGDSILDVLVADAASGGRVVVYPGVGNGALHPPSSFGTEARPEELVAEDFDGDGARDVAAVCSLGHAVSVLLNSGGGAFAPQVAYSLATLSPSRFAFGELTAGDWDGDGSIDLAAANGTSTLAGSPHIGLLLNLGDGSFSGPTFESVPLTYALETADFDLDGDLDLVGLKGSDGFLPTLTRVYVLLGDGTGDFTPGPEFEPSGDAVDLRVADWNDDGAPDLVLAMDPLAFLLGAKTFALLLNQGDASFSTHLEFGDEVARALEVVDLDEDGDFEILYGSFDVRGLVSIYEVEGGGVGSTPERFIGGGSIVGFSFGDMNHDGRLDLVTPGGSTYDLSILLRGCD